MDWSLDQNNFNEWVNIVGTTARVLCNDPSAKRIKFGTASGQRGFDYELTDKEAVDCIISSIYTYLYSMPVMQQEIYKRLINELELKKREF